MSLDGARPETVEKLRRGLKWERALEALAFVRSLRIAGNIDSASIHVVLQKDTYSELMDLLALASEYCIDTLVLTPLFMTGSYSQEEFEEISVASPQHPLFSNYKQALDALKQEQRKMLQHEKELRVAGKSVPMLQWTVQ